MKKGHTLAYGPFLVYKDTNLFPFRPNPGMTPNADYGSQMLSLLHDITRIDQKLLLGWLFEKLECQW